LESNSKDSKYNRGINWWNIKAHVKIMKNIEIINFNSRNCWYFI
jgi:hypothetical protein